MYPKTLVTLGDHIRKRRLDLGLRQEDVALTLGVDQMTVLGWEKNRQSPNVTVLPRIIAFLGYIPPSYNVGDGNAVEDMKRYRLVHGLSQKKFAELISADETTIANWEMGKHRPSKKLIEIFSKTNQYG